MTISSSLNAGVAGLAANATRLATISDNISNSSTFGYKRAETDFHSLVIANSKGRYSAGGVRATTQRMIDQRGSLVATDNPTDIAVRGRGMFPVTTEAAVNIANGEKPMLLQTTGSFRPDDKGYLRSSSGLVLMGWPANPDGTIPPYPRDSTVGLKPVRINANQFAGEPTTEMKLAVNLPATSTEAGSTAGDEPLSIEYFDNLGKSANLTVTFSPTVPATGSSNAWRMTITDSASGGAIVGEYDLTFDDSRGGGGTLLNVTDVSGGPYNAATGTFDVAVAGGPINVTIGTYGSPQGMTQLSDSFAPVNISKNGTQIGILTAIEIDQNGFCRASFDTGINRILYQIPLIDVPNINGLEALDQQSYRVTPASGSFFMWDAGDGPTGDVISFAREESTTDVAGELTALIQTQRAYSSNAKVIQTVDEMLQETTNIKR
ncbi:flagellar hook protein FlgE [Loktanella sp. M215]|uniref:flagellar hook protein FlgE n=1 Tax=Loktanella sp. M215 TaxID=2675431 RepID=UPI001F18B5E1|nr:flagellar hook-basal body complex protein [Loktanella sp. M215]MBU2360816.1 flagellar hook-basal body complex protein [Alphaproteobacteria bacterium]MCF7698824.1 flagellar hook-basal body complex protein [Loktanella sp. M215]